MIVYLFGHLVQIEGDIEFLVAVGAIDGERWEVAEVWDDFFELVDGSAFAFPLYLKFVWCEEMFDEFPAAFWCNWI